MKMHYPPETHSSCFMCLVYYSPIHISSHHIHLLNKHLFRATHVDVTINAPTLLFYWAQKLTELSHLVLLNLKLITYKFKHILAPAVCLNRPQVDKAHKGFHRQPTETY